MVSNVSSWLLFETFQICYWLKQIKEISKPLDWKAGLKTLLCYWNSNRVIYIFFLDEMCPPSPPLTTIPEDLSSQAKISNNQGKYQFTCIWIVTTGYEVMFITPIPVLRKYCSTISFWHCNDLVVLCMILLDVLFVKKRWYIKIEFGSKDLRLWGVL